MRLATRLCVAPVALISLVAIDRQWFKARIGFPSCETDLDASVCKYVLVEPDLLIIPDLAADPRTRDNPLVTGEPRVRFYAGAPLRTPEGYILGSLCVLDTVPRPQGLTPDQADDLRALARQVVDLLMLRRAVTQRDQVLEGQRVELRQARRVDVLAQATAALLTATDPAAVLDPILSTNAAMLGFDRSYTYEVRSDGRHLRLTHSLELPESLRAHLQRMPFGAPLCGIVAEHCRPLVLESIQHGGEPAYQDARDLGLDAYAGFPVTSRGSLQGVISFGSTQVSAFDAGALAFFETIARLMSAVYERLEAEKALRESDARSRLAQEAGRVGTYEVDIASHLMTVSPEFCRLFGLPVAPTYPAADIAARIVPEDAHLAFTDDSRRAGSGPLDVTYRIRRADDGALRWITRHAGFVRDEEGRPVRVFGTVQDITEARDTLRLLQENDERLRRIDERLQTALTASGVVGLWDWMVDSDLLHGDANFARLYGLDVERTAVGLTMEEYEKFIVPADLGPLRAAIRNTFEHGADFLVEYRLAIPGEPLRWVECKGRMIHDVEGLPVRFSGSAVDITARRHAESEARRLATIVEQSSDFIGVAHLDGTMAWVNEAGRRMVGLADAESARRTRIQDYFDPEQWPEIAATVFPAVDAEAQWRGELRFRHFGTGAFIPVIYDVIALRDPTGTATAYATVTRDITEQKRAQEQQEILNQELSHRLKNTLAIVLSIATQTLRTVPERAPVEAFERRVHALSTAHDVLLCQSWAAAPAKEVARAVLANAGHADRIEVSGPDVELGPRATLSLSLLLHELATNAAKYGALSVPAGRVAVDWRLEGEGERAEVALTWTERGGPPPSMPAGNGRKGFGSRLISRGLTGSGGVDLRYPTAGFEATMRAPLAQLQQF